MQQISPPTTRKRQVKCIITEVNLQALLSQHAISDKVNTGSSSSAKMNQAHYHLLLQAMQPPWHAPADVVLTKSLLHPTTNLNHSPATKLTRSHILL